MEIFDLMRKELTFLSAKEKSREEVFIKAGEKLYENEYINDKDKFIADLNYRESISETGLGEGIAIPHAVSHYVKKPIVLFFKLEKEIDWPSLDDKPVKYIFLLAVPKDKHNEMHLRILSKLATCLANERTISRIKEVKSWVELCQVFN